MNALIPGELEKSAVGFVTAYSNASPSEVASMIAGMTAIIQENEDAYENMRNQRWFERIWSTLTGKNKATVKEMQANREMLSNYIVQILVLMLERSDVQTNCINALSYALNFAVGKTDGLTEDIGVLACKLDEKIDSVAYYNWLLNEIRNEKFNVNTPLTSLIDIISFIDGRTARDTARLIQIKETMDFKGFDFSKKVNILEYAYEIVSLPEEKRGRILSLCQRLSQKNQLLAFTRSLMENYFYLCDENHNLVKDVYAAFSSAGKCAEINSHSDFSAGEMFHFFKETLPQAFELEQPNKNKGRISSSMHRQKTEEKHTLPQKGNAPKPEVNESPSPNRLSDENDFLSLNKIQKIKSSPNTHAVFRGWIFYIDVEKAYIIKVNKYRNILGKIIVYGKDEYLVSKVYAVKEDGSNNMLISGDKEVLVKGGISIEQRTNFEQRPFIQIPINMIMNPPVPVRPVKIIDHDQVLVKCASQKPVYGALCGGHPYNTYSFGINIEELIG